MLSPVSVLGQLPYEALALEPGPVRVRNPVLGTNAYLCPTGEPRTCVLVDPGADPAPVEQALSTLGWTPVVVVCTHGHFDHLGSAGRFQQSYSIPVVLHGADLSVARTARFLAMAFRCNLRLELPVVDVVVEGADQQLTVAGQHLRVLHTPGHTPGSSTLLYRGGAFTGDTLYRDGVGLVKLPGENIEVLRRTLRSLCTGGLRPETTVFPGHGGAAYLHEILSQNHALSDFLDSTDALVPATQQGGVS